MRLRLKTLSVLTPIFVALVVSTGFLRAQTPLFVDDFLLDNNGQPANSFNGFIQWNVTDGTVDLLGGNVLGAGPVELGGRFIDLDGSTNNAGLFATKMPITFAAGLTYTLSFLYMSTDGNPNAGFATIGSQTFNFSTSATGFQQFSQNFTFATATSSLLSFQDLGNDNAGIGIDRILVMAVPEPSAIFLLGGGAMFVAARRWMAVRRRIA